MTEAIDTPCLRELLEDGVGHADLVFGTHDDAVNGGVLWEDGTRWFGSGSESAYCGAVLTNDPQSVAFVLGAINVGVRLVSLPLPGRNSDLGAYAEHLKGIVGQYSISTIVARPDVVELLQSVGLEAISHNTARPPVVGAPSSSGFALVQFSSGSTGPAKGVELSNMALGANVRSIVAAVGPRSGDTSVSWLPLSHDMGLVGMLLTALVSTSPRWAGRSHVVLLDPQSFLRNPRIWTDALTFWKGTITASPDFGYRMAMAVHKPGEFDLSALRCAIVGGEVIRAETLDLVDAAWGQKGFGQEALCPAYGMAEIGLAATLGSPDKPWESLEVDPVALAGDVVDLSGTGLRLVSSGEALAGYDVAVEGGLDCGALEVSGPSIGTDRSGQSLESDGHFKTGDRGFLIGGQVYVCGRSDDYLVVHGRNVYAPALENVISGIPGIRGGRVTVVDSPTGDWLAAAEATPSGDGSAGGKGLEHQIRLAVVRAVGVAPTHVRVLAAGSLPMTSSGKIQRFEVRRRWIRGAL